MLGVYKTIGYLENRSKISKLEQYTFLSNEEIVTSFDYNQYHYILTKYYDDTSSWSHLHLLLKEKENHYLLKNIKKCDISESGENIYVKNNEVYIHCIGKIGNIDKYLISNLSIEKETLTFEVYLVKNERVDRKQLRKTKKEY